MTYEYMKSLDINCELKSDGVEIVMKSSEIPNIVKTLVNNNIGIYAVNQKRRSLEQDFISITTGSKTQIR
jgi:ABC-2 type transport system ATP-binding protein